jgi:hypothetical protein
MWTSGDLMISQFQAAFTPEDLYSRKRTLDLEVGQVLIVMLLLHSSSLLMFLTRILSYVLLLLLEYWLVGVTAKHS